MIDDFQIEEKSWRWKKLEQVMRWRDERDLPTIITTNEDKKRVYDHYKWILELLKRHYIGVHVDGYVWSSKKNNARIAAPLI